MTDKQFKSYVRLLLRDIDDVIEETSEEKRNEKLAKIAADLRTTLED